MFPAAKKGEWEPYKVRQRLVTVKKPVPAKEQSAENVDGAGGEEKKEQGQGEDTEMKDAPVDGQGDGQGEKAEDGEKMVEEEQLVYEEDTTSDEGATYPIRRGAIVDWPCFFALLTHIYNTLSPPFHTPIMLVAQPAWTARDREIITQFIFEKFKTPAFLLMDAALAVCYAYGTGTATVVDIGYEKADITAVTDFIVNQHGRSIALEGCGGEAMTGRLLELLQGKGFNRDMCEQLKKSNICEILPAGTPLPSAASLTGKEEPAKPAQPPGKGPEMSRNENEDDEGILDVAAIVTSGNTSEYLAKREKEKAERAAAAKKGAASADAAAGKAARLPNSKKEKATFQYEEVLSIDTKEESQNGTAPFMRQRREVEVGVERFQAVTADESRGEYGILEKLAAQIHHTILSVPEASKRSELWESLIILGNGSKIKGNPPPISISFGQTNTLQASPKPSSQPSPRNTSSPRLREQSSPLSSPPTSPPPSQQAAPPRPRPSRPQHPSPSRADTA